MYLIVQPFYDKQFIRNWIVYVCFRDMFHYWSECVCVCVGGGYI